MSRYFTLTAILLLANYVNAADARLEPLYSSNPALTGFLGSPGVGGFIEGKVVWHRSGGIFGLDQNRQGINPLNQWRMDPQTLRATRTAVYNVGDVWALSQKGDSLCALSRLGADKPELDPDRISMAWQAGNLGCFEMAGGARRWMLPMRNGESISGIAFTLDDKAVIVLSIWNGIQSLRLLQSSDGLLVRQYDFPEASRPMRFLSDRLAVRADEFWFIRPSDEGSQVLRVPLSTLQPVKVDLELPAGISGKLALSADGIHLAFGSNSEVRCLRTNGGKWQQSYVDEDLSWDEMTGGGKVLKQFQFSPDGKSLLVISSVDARITDLSSKKTRRIKLGENHGGAFSPDGRLVLVVYDHGMEAVSLSSADASHPARLTQNKLAPHLLKYLPDGKNLLAADVEGIWVWDMQSRRPRAWLKAQDEHIPVEAMMGTVSIVANGTEVIAEEGNDFLKWKLPPLEGAPPAKPAIITPVLAFGGVRQKPTYPYSGVYMHPDGTWVIAAQGHGNPTTVRKSLSDTSARTLSEKILVEPGQWLFRDSQFVFFDPIESQWKSLNLTDGVVTELKQRNNSLAVLPRAGAYVTERGVVSLFSDRVFPPFDYPRQFSFYPNIFAAVSADEKHVAAIMSDQARSHVRLIVFEVETGKLLGQTLVPGNDAVSVAFSPDGSQIACGHRNTSISLWEVAKLPPLPALPAVVATPPSGTKPSPAAAPKPVPSRPPLTKTTRPEHMFGSGIWDFHEDGSVGKGESFPQAAKLIIDGIDVSPKAHRLASFPDLQQIWRAQENFSAETMPRPSDPRFRPIPESRFKEVYAGLIHICEGQAGDYWVSRQAGNPIGIATTFLAITDTLTFQGKEAKNSTVEFVCQLPATVKGFIDSNFKPVDIEADGALKIQSEAVWIAAISEKGASPTVPIIKYRGNNGSNAMRLVWKKDNNTLAIRHSMAVKPGEVRHLMHGLRLIILEEGAGPTQFKAPASHEFSRMVDSSTINRSLNIDGYISDPMFRERPILPPRAGDEFSQSWDKLFDGSLRNADTVLSAHQLWIEDAPLPFASPSIFVRKTFTDSRPREDRGVHGSSLDGNVSVVRKAGRIDRQGMPFVSDGFLNKTESPISIRIAYVTTLAAPPAAIYNSVGDKIDPWKDPVEASKFGGSIIVEFAGEARPATALAFSEKGAQYEPRLSWIAPNLLKAEYTVTLAPRETTSLWHGATQRKLASFSSVSEAFTGTLPFARTGEGTAGKPVNLK
jgi:WD40 repeat protein